MPLKIVVIDSPYQKLALEKRNAAVTQYLSYLQELP